MGEDRGADQQGAAERVFDSLLEASHLAAPHQLPAMVAEHAARLGATDAV